MTKRTKLILAGLFGLFITVAFFSMYDFKTEKDSSEYSTPRLGSNSAAVVELLGPPVDIEKCNVDEYTGIGYVYDFYVEGEYKGLAYYLNVCLIENKVVSYTSTLVTRELSEVRLSSYRVTDYFYLPNSERSESNELKDEESI